MPKEILDRRASDNQYLHKDFHGALSVGIQYVDDNYGPEAVERYLRKFTLNYHAPLIESIGKRGLPALREHIERIYGVEGTPIEIEENENELVVRVPECPAVSHIKSHNYMLARLFPETTRVVNEVLVEGTPFVAELLDYNPETGAGVQRFSRRVTNPTSEAK